MMDGWWIDDDPRTVYGCWIDDGGMMYGWSIDDGWVMGG